MRGGSALNDPSPALADEDELRSSLAQIPIGGRAADPRELGRAVLYLASSDADYVTGECLRDARRSGMGLSRSGLSAGPRASNTG